MLRYSRKVRKRTKGIKIIFETMLHLPQNLRLIRLLSGKTQTEFGEEFGASKAMIVSYEKGKANPDELFLSRVSRYAGVSEEVLRSKKLGEDQVRLGKVEKVEKVPHETKTGVEGTYNERSLNNLTESNRVLAEANRTLAEANKTLAEANHVISKNHDQLIQLTKMIVANSTASQQLTPSRSEQHKELDRPAEDFLPPGTDLSKPAKKKEVVKK